MAITFPTSPSNGDTITSGDVTWTFDGEKWKHNIRGTAGVAYSVSAASGSTSFLIISLTCSIPLIGICSNIRLSVKPITY